MAYHGSCHCGAVQFTVEADLPEKAVSCNCSHCRRKGLLLAFVPREALKIESGQDNLQSYRFHKKTIEHTFCKTCGVQPFSFGQKPDGTPKASINLRCVPDLDLDTLPLHLVDGKNF